MRGLRPVAAGMYIGAITDFPFFADPYMSRAGRCGADDNRRYRADVDIDLGGCGKTGCGDKDSHDGENADMLPARLGDRSSKECLES